MMMEEDENNKFDPSVIIKAAEEKRIAGDISGAQMVFMSAILDWVDTARETVVADPEQVREAIATLWIAYANLHSSSNMFKSATEVYEQALNDPIAGSVGRVWLDYARFAQDRDKLRTAQHIYLRALVGDTNGNKPAAVTDDQDTQLLWNEFLDMMRKSKPNLTMKELKKAVEEEHVQQKRMTKGESLLDQTLPDAVTSATDEISEPREKKQRLESPPTTLRTHPVTTEAVQEEAKELLEATQVGLPPEISAAWFVRDGDSPPTLPQSQLFSASPPKLTDPTGKDILGSRLALAVIQRLLKKDDSDSSGTVLLEVCRGLWMLTALKEQEASKAVERVDQSITAEMEELDKRLETRLSVAGAASSAVQQMNENERNAFQQSCFQQREDVLNSIAWDFRKVLCAQQQILTTLRIPGFDGPTIDTSELELQKRLCSYLHSAFYLRSRIGEAAHEAMLKSQAERLKKDVESASVTLRPPPSYPVQMPPQPPTMYPQQPPMQPGMYMQQQYPSQAMPMMPPGPPPNVPYGQPPYYQ